PCLARAPARRRRIAAGAAGRDRTAIGQPCRNPRSRARAGQGFRQCTATILGEQKMTATLLADEAAFETLYPLKPFRIRHELVDDERLTLPAILDLVKLMPRDRIEYNSGKAAVSQ